VTIKTNTTTEPPLKNKNKNKCKKKKIALSHLVTMLILGQLLVHLVVVSYRINFYMIYLCELNTIFNVHYNDFYMLVFVLVSDPTEMINVLRQIITCMFSCKFLSKSMSDVSQEMYLGNIHMSEKTL
jgi:hypothetical protein